ncbi:hypothetical protein TNCV_2888451 [Trichonephila clavipes]|nr:hypothetical protein TNCV_2888451 [Trichonephila clavipes]
MACGRRAMSSSPIATEDPRCRGANASSPTGDDTAYHLLHRLINRQVAKRAAKNDVNLALSPTFRYVSIELPL